MYQNYFQSKEWRDVKQSKRWQVDSVESAEGPINCFRNKSPLGNIIYVPGLDKITSAALSELEQYYTQHQRNSLVIKVEPLVPINPAMIKVFEDKHWQVGRNIQYSYTVMLDLAKPVDQLLAEVKKRGRYEIRQAQNAGVKIMDTQPD